MKLLKLTLLLAIASTSWAQTLLPPVPAQFFAANGTALSGGKICTYTSGTFTPKLTYTDYTLMVANGNPVILNSIGQANIWLSTGTYRITVMTPGSDSTCSTGSVLSQQDGVTGSVGSGTNATANYVYAGPTSGPAAAPTFRALVAADIPSLTLTLASSTFANQGTTTTLLHGNAAGNPSWGNVAAADFGSSITARTAFGRASSSSGAPSFATTVDVLAYQVAEIPSSVFVSTDFTTSGVGTALEAITGLSWTVPASTALNIPFACYITYSQATGNAAVALGIQDVTVSPTNIGARGVIYTNTTASTEGNLSGLNSTTATAIVSATPAATATTYIATVNGFVEAPSNASSTVVQIMASTATAADTVTVKRGSYCRVN